MSNPNNATHDYTLGSIIPDNGAVGTWIGRAWVPASLDKHGIAGPHVILVKNGQVHSMQDKVSTVSELIEFESPAQWIDEQSELPLLCSLAELEQNSLYFTHEESMSESSTARLLAPNDLMAVKACGVTFIKSLLERVVEEKAGGDPRRAEQLRQKIISALGENLSEVKPGSPETEALKKELIQEGIWSQYLEVGLGKDAEVFTKHQVLASVSFGHQIGVLSESHWNNPAPEVVLAVSSKGNIVGATLGNDVNLRDYEGRSALLLGEAKDQNGSCSIGPFIRLFDDSFTLEDVKNCEIELSICGSDGFNISGKNKMSEISRSPEELVAQAIGKNHQYPDGLVLFLGTMFAPTEDRNNNGEGFTHHLGDKVEISTPLLGKLVNWVNHCHKIPQWDYGIRDLFKFLQQKSMLSQNDK